MGRIALPGFKLLIAGAIAAAAYAYHKGEFPDSGKAGDAAKRPAASGRVPTPPRAVQPQRAAMPPAKATRGVAEKNASERARAAAAKRPMKELAMPKPMLTGSVAKPAKPRPPESVPSPAAK